MTYSQLLVQEIQQRYQVGADFVRIYLDYALTRDYQTLADLLAAPPPLPMWVDYAMSTNHRGQVIYDLLKPSIPVHARRYLDVGCGYGGFLVAFAQYGLEVCGIEIDPQRIRFAQANCRDHQLTDCIFQDDILDGGIVERLGKFDVITCNDVIEHVLDVPKAIQNMTAMLNPGGILMLEIPNKDSLGFVASDGHFNLFGMMLLDRPAAIDYHKAFFSFAYDIGDYYELGSYQRELEKNGCQMILLPSPPLRQNFQTTLISIWAGYRRYWSQHRRKLPAALNRKLHLRLAQYMLRMGGSLLLSFFSATNRERFRQRYRYEFWCVLGIAQNCR